MATETWNRLRVQIPREHADAVADFLIAQGSPGVELQDDLGQTTVTAYFRGDPPVEAVTALCVGLSGPYGGGPTLDVAPIATQDWAENWKQHFRGEPVGRRLFVCPPWDTRVPSDRIALVIDPGMAFGTGQHATTRGCLECIEAATTAARPHRALDVGTGSGILAIALAKLGVDEVWAVDIDPVACDAAVHNAEANAVAANVRVESDLSRVPGTFDLVVANLFANALVDLAPGFAARLRPGGCLILSGLLVTDEARVLSAYRRLGCTDVTRVADGEWVTLRLALPT